MNLRAFLDLRFFLDLGDRLRAHVNSNGFPFESNRIFRARLFLNVFPLKVWFQRVRSKKNLVILNKGKTFNFQINRFNFKWIEPLGPEAQSPYISTGLSNPLEQSLNLCVLSVHVDAIVQMHVCRYPHPCEHVNNQRI